MDAIAFCGSVVGVALVIFWYVRNERQGPDRATTGWFAMREPKIGDQLSGSGAKTASRSRIRRSRGPRAMMGGGQSSRPPGRS